MVYVLYRKNYSAPAPSKRRNTHHIINKLLAKGRHTMKLTNPWWKGYKYSHIKIPKALLKNPQYASISPLAKLLYGFLLLLQLKA